MQKRNPKTREYEPYETPRNYHCPLITNDMNEPINCASCWIETTYGVCYTSKEIHTEIWFWYPVCEDCYNAEVIRKKFYSSST